MPPGDLIAIAARHGSDFCAGEYWYYSNTGYVMLARILEQVEGAPYHEVIRRRILEPLHLSRTVALAPRMKLASLATCYSGTRPDTDFDPSLPFGAGVIVGPADDMVRYWEALLTGRLLPRESVARMFERLYPMFDPGTFYGRGVMVYEFGTGADAGTWLGHSGGKEGCKAVVAFDVRTRLYVAVALNGDVSAEACANRLLKEASAGLGAASR